MMKMASEMSVRMIPQFMTPGCPAGMAAGGYNVQPEPVAPPGNEETRHQDQHGQQKHPVAEHVHDREDHVAGADPSAGSGSCRIRPGTAP